MLRGCNNSLKCHGLCIKKFGNSEYLKKIYILYSAVRRQIAPTLSSGIAQESDFSDTAYNLRVSDVQSLIAKSTLQQCSANFFDTR